MYRVNKHYEAIQDLRGRFLISEQCKSNTIFLLKIRTHSYQYTETLQEFVRTGWGTGTVPPTVVEGGQFRFPTLYL